MIPQIPALSRTPSRSLQWNNEMKIQADREHGMSSHRLINPTSVHDGIL